MSATWNSPHWLDGHLPSAALLDLAHKRLSRMDAAINLGTIHASRLQELRDRLVRRLERNDGREIAAWLADYGAAISAECRAAERAAEKRRLAA